MSDAIVDTVAEARALELPPLVIRQPLEQLLDEQGIGAGPLDFEPLGEGHSNVTLLLRRGADEYVLRRPPRPPLSPRAHDVVREARLLGMLEPTPVRTPRVLLTCKDPTVIGAPFYLMERIHGDVINTVIPDRLATLANRWRVGEEIVDALVEIHALDWRGCGLSGFGSDRDYLERQLRRFSGIWAANRTRDLPELDRVTAWLSEDVPESRRSTLVHGDYRLGNAIFAPGRSARLVAVLDWELATIGDPLADLGYLTANWGEPGDAEDVMTGLGAATRTAGFMSRDELVAAYEERSGHEASAIEWYQVLAVWKSVIFLESSYRRFLAGTTQDPFFKELGEGVPTLAQRALALVDRTAA